MCVGRWVEGCGVDKKGGGIRRVCGVCVVWSTMGGVGGYLVNIIVIEITLIKNMIVIS